jgi:hypothetical protein
MAAMEVEPPLPPMHLLGGERGLKRQVSRNAEQSDGKRNFFGQGRYEDIVHEIVKTFSPLMEACSNFEEVTLSKQFEGRNSEGLLDKRMEVLFVGYSFNPAGNWVDRGGGGDPDDGYDGDREQPQTYANPGKRMYRVTFRLIDSYGFVPTRRLMERHTIPATVDVQCGLSGEQLYSKLIDIATQWMDFVSEHFKLARVARNSRPLGSGLLSTVAER